jgi:hypothetical protein
MQVYLTIILSLAISRFIGGEIKEGGKHIIATLICIASEIVGIVFVWVMP